MNARTNRATLCAALLLLSLTGSAPAIHALGGRSAPPEQGWSWALKPSDILDWITDMTDRFWRHSGARIEGNGMAETPEDTKPDGPDRSEVTSSRTGS